MRETLTLYAHFNLSQLISFNLKSEANLMECWFGELTCKCLWGSSFLISRSMRRGVSFFLSFNLFLAFTRVQLITFLRLFMNSFTWITLNRRIVSLIVLFVCSSWFIWSCFNQAQFISISMAGWTNEFMPSACRAFQITVLCVSSLQPQHQRSPHKLVRWFLK